MNLKNKETWRNLLAIICSQQKKRFKKKSALLLLSPSTWYLTNCHHTFAHENVCVTISTLWLDDSSNNLFSSKLNRMLNQMSKQELWKLCENTELCN